MTTKNNPKTCLKLELFITLSLCQSEGILFGLVLNHIRQISVKTSLGFFVSSETSEL